MRINTSSERPDASLTKYAFLASLIWQSPALFWSTRGGGIGAGDVSGWLMVADPQCWHPPPTRGTDGTEGLPSPCLALQQAEVTFLEGDTPWSAKGLFRWCYVAHTWRWVGKADGMADTSKSPTCPKVQSTTDDEGVQAMVSLLRSAVGDPQENWGTQRKMQTPGLASQMDPATCGKQVTRCESTAQTRLSTDSLTVNMVSCLRTSWWWKQTASF